MKQVIHGGDILDALDGLIEKAEKRAKAARHNAVRSHGDYGYDHGQTDGHNVGFAEGELAALKDLRNRIIHGSLE